MNGDTSTVVRLIRGPIMLILVGSLFAAGQWTEYSFRRTWPLLIIVFGLLKLLERLAGGQKSAGLNTTQGGQP